MKLFTFSKGEGISVDSHSAVSPFVLKTPVNLKEWCGINLEEDFFMTVINFYNVSVCIFNNIRKFVNAKITFEVFALTAHTVYLRQ